MVAPNRLRCTKMMRDWASPCGHSVQLFLCEDHPDPNDYHGQITVVMPVVYRDDRLAEGVVYAVQSPEGHAAIRSVINGERGAILSEFLRQNPLMFALIGDLTESSKIKVLSLIRSI